MIKFTVTNDDGDDVEYELPSKFEVCSRCEGHGTHLNPSIGEHAYSQVEFEEAFCNEEDQEQYFKRGGIYDVTCETCDGKRVEEVVDEELSDKGILALYHQKLDNDCAYERECAAERRYGC